jgi:hypothetical protein
MLIETLLIDQRPDAEQGISTPSCTASRHPSAKEIHSPVTLRSEAEQLVGQELIKVLSNFKQLAVASSPLKTQQATLLVNVSDVECLLGTQSLSHHQKIKLNCQKPVVKVVQYILTMRWVFLKRNKQLCNLSPPSKMKGICWEEE